MTSATLLSPPHSGFVTLSFCRFVFWWIVIVCVHLVSFLYATCYAKLYWEFHRSFLSYTLQENDVGLPREHFHTIANVHIVLAAVHGFYLILVIAGSLWRRTLVFYPWADSKWSETPTNIVYVYDETKWQTRVFQKLKTLYIKTISRHGVFGVNGRYFYVVLTCREIVEMTFQSIQAFRMSKYLSSRVLNHVYVSLLVMSCWSSVFIHARLFGGDDARRRLAAIVCDCALDLMSSMGVAMMIVVPYVRLYDAEVKNFSLKLLQNDSWIAEMLDEARMVLVVSWSDLVARIIFSLGVVSTTKSMKNLLRWTSSTTDNTNLPKNSYTTCTSRVMVSKKPNPCTVTPVQENEGTKAVDHQKASLSPCVDPVLWGHISRGLLTAVHVAFVSLGIVILVLHVHASLKAPLVECNPKVNAMAGARPACFAVEFNCYELGIKGTREEITTEWNKFDHTTVVKLNIRHCPALEIPESFRNFGKLLDFGIYNSTIREWGELAATANSHHPSLRALSIVRSNMTDGVLPLGIQSFDFPRSHVSIYFCETNLQTLPDDLDAKWNIGSSIFIENSQISEVPSAFVRLNPIALVLTGNPITEVQPELFKPDIIQYLDLRRTKVTKLPKNVTNSMVGPGFFDFSDTNITFFWSWMDPFVRETLGNVRLSAGGSPYCDDLENIMNGASTDFSVPFQNGYSPLLMNASEANWEILQQSIDCSPTFSLTEFPLETWDTQYALVGTTEAAVAEDSLDSFRARR